MSIFTILKRKKLSKQISTYRNENKIDEKELLTHQHKNIIIYGNGLHNELLNIIIKTDEDGTYFYLDYKNDEGHYYNERQYYKNNEPLPFSLAKINEKTINFFFNGLLVANDKKKYTSSLSIVFTYKDKRLSMYEESNNLINLNEPLKILESIKYDYIQCASGEINIKVLNKINKTSLRTIIINSDNHYSNLCLFINRKNELLLLYAFNNNQFGISNIFTNKYKEIIKYELDDVSINVTTIDKEDNNYKYKKEDNNFITIYEDNKVIGKGILLIK